jgi:Uma2 family endonuclease
MSIALRKPMTLAEFLAWEERQELRFEFDGIQPVAMVGGTVAHSAIQRNLLFHLTAALRGKPCQPHGSHLKIQVAGRIRYPDAFVVCTPTPGQAKIVTDPVVGFEILSESTADDDLTIKNAEYRATPSIARYVVLQQSHARAIVFRRKGEDWVTELVFGPDAVLRLPEVGVEIALADVYEDIELAPDQAEPGSA